jgi:hypothetical protein
VQKTTELERNEHMTLTQQQKTVIRIVFAINIAAAGVPGFLITFFPRFAETSILSASQDMFTMGIAGSVWFAIGLLSIVGLFFPLQLSPIFLLQAVYKCLWVVAVGLPLLRQEDGRALPFILFFTLATLLFLYAFPFRVLFQTGEPRLERGSVQVGEK